MAAQRSDTATTAGPMTPIFHRIERRRRETHDVVTLELKMPEASFRPGQFNMLYAFGCGEVPISMSGDAAAGSMVHTIRAVGPVSKALTELKRGDLVGVRGPFGSAWPIDAATGCDILIVAGGIGLAPLRPVLYEVLRSRERFGRVALLYGARSPAELLYRREVEQWRRTPGVQVRVTVDVADSEWTGDVGIVTSVLHKLRFDPRDTVAMMCGPEIMNRFMALALHDMGMPDERLYIAMERNMKCAIGMCGHCQFGPEFVCKDGPVFRFDRIANYLRLREI